MTSETSTLGAGHPSAATIPQGYPPRAYPRGRGSLQSPASLSYGQLEEASIDPQLSNGEERSENTQIPGQDADLVTEQVLSERADSPSSFHRNSQLQPVISIPRLLPAQSVSDVAFDDAYVSFILYCNPAIPPGIDTAELKKAFRSPPKSDGKNFSTFTLFELIRKLELKEIKTWAQLAMDLGVEPPAVDKGQSAQKVQQYAVRLKRWMHAMHIDAFFEYLLDKAHGYWTHIPSIDDPPSEFGRDGVVPEEDLALRALLPETRPKRGRRKAEDRDKDSELGKSPAQRPRLNSPTLSDDFAIARGSLVESITPSVGHSEWTASETRVSFIGHPTVSLPTAPEGQQWNAKDSNETPFTPHPHSAFIPRTANPFLPFDGESQSAVTPTSTRSRRRHGPAVSSAWPSSGTFSAGKLRGRPPSNRSISDGPFSTFPANPNTKLGPTINLRDTNIPPIVESSEAPTSPFSFSGSPAGSRPQAAKPSRLHLQVPERIGGTVRLATPPPTVLVNGETHASQEFYNVVGQEQKGNLIMDLMPKGNGDNHLDRGVSPSSNQEFPGAWKGLRDSSLSNSLAFRDELGEDHENVDGVEFLFIQNILAADWFDHKGSPMDRCSPEEARQMAKQVIQNLRDEATTKETFLINLSALAGGDFLRTRKNFLKISRLEPENDIAVFGVEWTLKFGAIVGAFNMKINVQRKQSANEEISQSTLGDEEKDASPDWKEKYMELRKRITEVNTGVKEVRATVFNAVVNLNSFEF